MKNKTLVPDIIGEYTALFLFNQRITTLGNVVIEDFHLRYIDGKEYNPNFEYTSLLELEYGVAITGTGEVRLFINSFDKNKACFLHYHCIGAFDVPGEFIFRKAFELIPQTKEHLKLVFIFSTGLWSNGAIVYSKTNLNLFASKTSLEIQQKAKEYFEGNSYLVMVDNNDSITVEKLC